MKTKIICEIGSNWKSLDDILYSCEWAVENGVVPKLQAWNTSKTVNRWRNPKMYSVMKKYEIPHDWIKKINDRFPTTIYSVFDTDTLQFLEEKICPDAYKIASPDCVFMPLLMGVALTGRQAIVSVGGATLDEIRACAKIFDWKKLTLMACVVDYPCKDAELNYFRDRVLGSRLISWGYSSHSRSKLVPVAAVALGATTIEAHFSLSPMETPDAPHSFSPNEFMDIINGISEIEQNMGNSERPMPCEAKNLKAARRKGDGKR